MNSRAVPPACRAGALAVLLAVPLVPSAGHAEPVNGSGASATGLRLSWPDIVKLVDAHPRIAASQHRAAAARAGIDAAGAVPNPGIEASTALGQARETSASRVEWGLGLSIPLGWIARRGARVDAAAAEARAAEAATQALRRDVLLQLRILFWNLVREQERTRALAELSEQTTALARTVRRRVENGASRPVEAARVEIEAEKVAADLAVVRSILSTRRAQLRLWLAAPDNRPLIAVADLGKLPRPMPVAEARERVRTRHPSLAAARARIQALTASVSLERRARIPAFSVQAFTDHELDRAAYGVGLAMDLPVWNWNTGNIRRAEASLAAGRSQLDADRIGLESIVVEAQSACQAGVAHAARYRDHILPRAESAARTIERTYQLGEASLLEVIDARRTLLETRTQLLEALAQAQTECSRLTVLAGEELP